MISVENLTKSYGSGRPSVDDVSFSCAPGTVTGFLGPTGAGKSTTLRALVGLTPPTSGRATVNGVRYADLPNPGRVAGVMLDAGAQHPGRTGPETLRLTAMLLGVPKGRADAMLERVGLQGAERRRVKDYSLGMRQRLGIAQALLGDPSVLLLDEPANGLDPEGIRWMRGLLRDFAAGGGTVLVSSHLLREVEATADRLVVIDHGRVVAQGSLAERTGGADAVVVRGLDPLALLGALRAAGLAPDRQPDGSLLVRAGAEAVGRAAAAAGQVLGDVPPFPDRRAACRRRPPTLVRPAHGRRTPQDRGHPGRARAARRDAPALGGDARVPARHRQGRHPRVRRLGAGLDHPRRPAAAGTRRAGDAQRVDPTDRTDDVHPHAAPGARARGETPRRRDARSRRHRARRGAGRGSGAPARGRRRRAGRVDGPGADARRVRRGGGAGAAHGSRDGRARPAVGGGDRRLLRRAQRGGRRRGRAVRRPGRVDRRQRRLRADLVVRNRRVPRAGGRGRAPVGRAAARVRRAAAPAAGRELTPRATGR